MQFIGYCVAIDCRSDQKDSNGVIRVRFQNPVGNTTSRYTKSINIGDGHHGTELICSFDKNNKVSLITVILKPGSLEWTGKMTLLEPGGVRSHNMICAGKNCVEENILTRTGMCVTAKLDYKKMDPHMTYCDHSCTLYPFYN